MSCFAAAFSAFAARKRPKIAAKGLLFAALCFVFTAASAQRTLYFRNLSVADGLGDMTVSAIYRDSIGYVWVGTATGADRFDGAHFKHFPLPGDDPKLKRVNAFIELHGKLLMGNDTGLWLLDTKKGEWRRIFEEVISGKVKCFATIKGKLYAGTAKGLYLYAGNTFRRVPVDPDKTGKSKSIAGMAVDGKGRLWLATDAGLYSYSAENGAVKHYDYDGETPLLLNCIVCVGDRIFLGTENKGIYSFDISAEKFSKYVDVGCNAIPALGTDGDKFLFVGTYGNGTCCIFVPDNKVIQYAPTEETKHGVAANAVFSLLVDRDSVSWIGYDQMGLDYSLYQNRVFSLYSFPPYFDSADMFIRTFCLHEKQKLIGTRNGFVFIDEEKRLFKHLSTPQIRTNMVISSAFYNGEYYVGTLGGGLYVFNPDDLSVRDFRPNEEPFAGGQFFDLAADGRGCLWIASSDGLYCFKGTEELAHYTAANSPLPEGNVHRIVFDSSGRGWVLTAGGMCIWDAETRSLTADAFPKGFASGVDMRSMYEDRDHTLYFLPDVGTLFVSDFNMENYGYIPSDTPLKDKKLMSVIEDGAGYLLIGTDNGMFRYDKKGAFEEYTFADGMPSRNNYTCVPRVDDGGTVWFGNTKGLLSLNITALGRRGTINYHLRITDITAEGGYSNPVIEAESDSKYVARLNPFQRNVSVYFSDLTFIDPTIVAYEYNIKGTDEGWTPVAPAAPLTFNGLSAGTHTVRLRVIDKPQTEITLLLKREAVVKWQCVVLVIAAIGGVILFVLWRRRRGKTPLPEDESGGEAPEEGEEDTYKTYKMTEEEAAEMAEKLHKAVHEGKLYLRGDLKLADLSASTGVSAPLLSYYFNKQLGKTFHEFVNDCRAEEFKEMVRRGEYRHYTVATMASLCGFSSRSSFFRYFKNSAGITPAKYIQEAEIEAQEDISDGGERNAGTTKTKQ